MSAITINGISVDPAAPQPVLASLSLANATAKDSDYLLVQTRHPLDRGERARLAKAGAKILEAVPGGAFVCHFPKTDLRKVRALDFVAWADVYPRVVKIAPSLRRVDVPAGGVSATVAALAVPGARDATRVTVDVVLHRNASVRTAAMRVADAAHLTRDQVKVGRRKLRLTLKARRLADVAALDEVRHVERVFTPKLHNSVARQILRVPSGASPRGGEGRGEVVAVADTGFDRGSTSDVHPAFTGRVKRLYALGRARRKDDPDGHGTHVAGSVLGDGVSTADGPVRGTAPQAKLVLQSVLDDDGELGGLPDDLHDLFRPPYVNDRARIHTNSWGTDENLGVYDQQAYEVDAFVCAHRDLVICFCAGNEARDGNGDGRVDANSVTPPGTAKNCLTVGACESERPQFVDTYGEGWPDDFPANPMRSDTLADDPEGMAAFSGRGPTNDGRIKPDVVAPGCYILSARSRATRSTAWGLSRDRRYMFDGGTSMATPLVAGCVAVLRAFLRAHHRMKKPSAALLKALIINGAHNLAGQYVPSESGTIPNNNEGFGRVDLAAVVGPYAANEHLHFFDESRALDTGERAARVFPLPAGVRRLKATLVWTDPPGEGLQSDLDLVVVAGGRERHGNMPALAAGFDRTNNVEQVTWTDVPGPRVTVAVIAHATTLAAQRYALVVRLS